MSSILFAPILVLPAVGLHVLSFERSMSFDRWSQFVEPVEFQMNF